MASLRAVSDAWLLSGGHRERTFTLGRFDPVYLESTLYSRSSTSMAASWRFQHAASVSVDSRKLRFDAPFANAPNGAMDALFAAMIDTVPGATVLAWISDWRRSRTSTRTPSPDERSRRVPTGGPAFNFEGRACLQAEVGSGLGIASHLLRERRRPPEARRSDHSGRRATRPTA